MEILRNENLLKRIERSLYFLILTTSSVGDDAILSFKSKLHRNN